VDEPIKVRDVRFVELESSNNVEEACCNCELGSTEFVDAIRYVKECLPTTGLTIQYPFVGQAREVP
jgi:hypothetical protein